MHLNAGSLLALLVGHLAHVGINFVDGQARPGLKVPAVLNLHRPLVTSCKPNILQGFAAVGAVAVVHQLPKLNGFVNAWVIHSQSSIHPGACGLGNWLGFALVRFPNHKPNVSEGISAVAVMVVQGVAAELPGVWVYLVTVMAQTGQPISCVFPVKVTVAEYCPGGVDAVHHRNPRQYLGLVACCPHNVVNAAPSCCKRLVLGIVREPNSIEMVAVGLHGCQVKADGLLAVLNVPNQPGFHAHELQEPDGSGVRPSQVKHTVNRLCGIEWHSADAPI